MTRLEYHLLLQITNPTIKKYLKTPFSYLMHISLCFQFKLILIICNSYLLYVKKDGWKWRMGEGEM